MTRIIGTAPGAYGARVTVLADKPGAVRLSCLSATAAAGSCDVILTREQWALLVSYGDEALGIITEAAAVRDIPASCPCQWRYDEQWHSWQITAINPACTRHGITPEKLL